MYEDMDFICKNITEKYHLCILDMKGAFGCHFYTFIYETCQERGILVISDYGWDLDMFNYYLKL